MKGRLKLLCAAAFLKRILTKRHLLKNSLKKKKVTIPSISRIPDILPKLDKTKTHKSTTRTSIEKGGEGFEQHVQNS
jgi:hypothetical protein